MPPSGSRVKNMFSTLLQIVVQRVYGRPRTTSTPANVSLPADSLLVQIRAQNHRCRLVYFCGCPGTHNAELDTPQGALGTHNQLVGTGITITVL